MAKPAMPPAASDDEVRALLARYHCPLPFHAVRTRLLGAIASPDPDVSPIKTIEALWGGTLPPFDSVEAVNELFGALLMGLWGRLTRHQERSAPFRLVRIDVAPTRQGLGMLAQMRQQEVEGFIEGLFGDNEDLDVPEVAHKSLGLLTDIRAMAEGTAKVALDLTKAGTPAEAADMLLLYRKLTRIAEHEIHAVVLACARARRQRLRASPASRPARH